VNGELDEIWKKAAEIRKKADRIIEEGETDEQGVQQTNNPI
jgi:hypothetical protein